MFEAPLSDRELLAALVTAMKEESARLASVIGMLMEVNERQLHLRLGNSSLWDFCTRRLGMSESQTFTRLAAMKLAQRFPQVLEAIRERRIHISHAVLLRDVMTNTNVDALIAAASGKSKREVEQLVAREAPKPDVPTRIQKLPAPGSSASAPLSLPLPGQSHLEDSSSTVPSAPVPPLPFASSRASTTSEAFVTLVSPDPPQSRSGATPTMPRPPMTPRVPVRAQVTPLSEARHKVQFTASTELRELIERAQLLLRHCNVDGDLAVVIERALVLLIAKLEKQRLATRAGRRKTDAAGGAKARTIAVTRPAECSVPDAMNGAATETARSSEESSAAGRSAHVPLEVRREVVRRDGEQCTFVGETGERCQARALLEIDHRHPRALGGRHDAANLRVLCRAHNRFAAEEIFGREYVARAIRSRRRNRRGNDVEEGSAGPCSHARATER